MVAARLLEAFLPCCVKEMTEVALSVYMQSFFYQIGITSRDETGLSFGLCYPMVMSPDTVALCFSALNGYTADSDTVFIDIQFYD